MNSHAALGFAWILSVVVGAGAASAQPTAPAEGHWEGTIQIPGQALSIVVDLAALPDGRWDGTISIPAQNITGFTLSPLTVEGERVTFGMKGVPGDPLFKGKVSKDPRSIAGEYTQGQAALPFTLAWKGAPKIVRAQKSPAIATDLEGSWEGAVDIQGTSLRLVVKLANEAGHGVGMLTSVDQGGAVIPVTAISRSGSHVTLLVSTIGGSFDGELKEGRLEGTWTQGGQGFPLVLRRTAE